MLRRSLYIIAVSIPPDVEWVRQGGQLANVGTFYPSYVHRHGNSILRHRLQGKAGVQCRRYFAGVG